MAAPKKTKFVDPMKSGVTYDQFIKAMGTKSVREYLKGKPYSEHQIVWLENEIKQFKK